jgi:DNA sulfur modification protein DndD
LKEIREKVERRTWTSFQKLHWDSNNYKIFEIEDSYHLRLIHKTGENMIYNMADSVKQSILLSFIAALSQVSGFEFPVFIDTPLANLDNDQREEVAKNLPTFMEGVQVIMLMKDQEYTPTFRNLIKKRVSKEIRLVKINDGRTEVRKWN